jgi:GH25 family lysozyme M1 (1,4-beta-N-acetylmuramidase)
MTYALTSGQEVQLILDVWEGQPEISTAVLKAGNVAGMFIRLNDMNGGHHADATFRKMWELYKDFVRCPYFVFNPWVTGEENFRWLIANAPSDSPCVMADIEVAYSSMSPEGYGEEVKDFINLCNIKWKTVIYTGEWFLEKVSPWPKGEYWWAQYPYSMYPSSRISVTWEQLRSMIMALKWPPINFGKCPGTIKLWQCSGDKLITPGSTRALDINLFPGTLDDLRSWLRLSSVTPPPPPVLTYEQKVDILWREADLCGWDLDP